MKQVTQQQAQELHSGQVNPEADKKADHNGDQRRSLQIYCLSPASCSKQQSACKMGQADRQGCDAFSPSARLQTCAKEITLTAYQHWCIGMQSIAMVNSGVVSVITPIFTPLLCQKLMDAVAPEGQKTCVA